MIRIAATISFIALHFASLTGVGPQTFATTNTETPCHEEHDLHAAEFAQVEDCCDHGDEECRCPTSCVFCRTQSPSTITSLIKLPSKIKIMNTEYNFLEKHLIPFAYKFELLRPPAHIA